jgi:hypothetical protein
MQSTPCERGVLCTLPCHPIQTAFGGNAAPLSTTGIATITGRVPLERLDLLQRAQQPAEAAAASSLKPATWHTAPSNYPTYLN